MTSAFFLASFKVQHVRPRLKLYFYFTAFFGGGGGFEVVLLDVCEDLLF